jgi:hypothetical protein
VENGLYGQIVGLREVFRRTVQNDPSEMSRVYSERDEKPQGRIDAAGLISGCLIRYAKAYFCLPPRRMTQTAKNKRKQYAKNLARGRYRRASLVWLLGKYNLRHATYRFDNR